MKQSLLRFLSKMFILNDWGKFRWDGGGETPALARYMYRFHYEDLKNLSCMNFSGRNCESCFCSKKKALLIVNDM